MNAADLEHVSGILRAVVIRIAEGLTHDDVKSVWELIDAPEPGVALEDLCTQLYGYDVALPLGVVIQFKAAGQSKGLEPSLLENLLPAHRRR